MRKSLIILTAVILLSITAFSQPDTLWTQTFGGSFPDYGESVQQTTDGGYIIAGRTGSYPNYDVYLIKSDTNGNEQWWQTFGGSSDDEGKSVQQTSDGGYIIAGYTSSYGAGNLDVYLIKTDASGNEIWYQTFGGSCPDYGESVQQTDDGGYVIAGYTWSYGAGYSDIYLIKTDASGNETWYQTFGGSLLDYGRSVQQTSDGGYIIAGYTYFYWPNFDVYLIKTDASGNETWYQTLGGSFPDDGYSVQQTSDGGYIIVGETESFGAGGSDVYLIKTDASGNEQWSQTFGGSGWDYGESVKQTIDGGYIIAGRTNSYGAGDEDVCLIKTDAEGNREWWQTFGGSNYDRGNSVQQTSDGGYIIAGYTHSYGAGEYDVWLIRLEAEIPSTITLILTPQNPPIQIPANGGSFNFNIAATNSGTSPVTFDVWTYATLPSGAQYGPIINVSDFTLAAGGSIDRNRTQEVPAGAPTGAYTYDAYVGDYPDDIWDEDHFDFEKLGADGGGWFGSPSDWFCIGEPFPGERAQSSHPSSFILHPCSPNPFNPTTAISYQLQAASFVTLIVYDVRGREVAMLADGFKPAGVHEATFDGSALSSGVYFARLTAGELHQTQKLLLIK